MTETAAKPARAWKRSYGPIIASPRIVELAEAINGLLTSPIAVLPTSVEGIVKPFAIGISQEIAARIKPDASLPALKSAIRHYAQHRTYLFAMAQPDAARHDIEGNPVEPVSEENRLSAMKSYLHIKDAIEKRRKEREQAEAQAQDAA